jgi:hypothetical protein
LRALFVNGVGCARNPPPAPRFTTSGALRIGGNAFWGELLQGIIDEVRSTTGPLSGNEIQADMTTAVCQVGACEIAPWS